MNKTESANIIKNFHELEDALSMRVKINHEQVLHIVVTDLIDKYQHAVSTKSSENVELFEKVLKYYVTKDEFEKIHESISQG